MRLIKIAARITETGRSGSHRIRRRLPDADLFSGLVRSFQPDGP
jgi:hypothetical protein